MHAMWLSLKECVNCGRKLTDIIPQSHKIRRDRRCILGERSPGIELVHQMGGQVFGVISRKNWYSELKDADPSRKIIEMIFQAASACPPKPCRKVRKVLRVNNSMIMVERFEMYREVVKKRARDQHRTDKGHLRSMVDGNELLQFYGTTMNCCTRKPSAVSKTCKDLSCGVCRTVQSGFNTTYLRKHGIRLSTSSEDLSEEEMFNITGGKKAKRAVIVCRTIAGRVAHVDNEESPEEYDSKKVEAGLHSKSEYLVVKNPSAVLPCFIVVFS